MKQETYELFRSNTLEEILTFIDTELEKRNESPIWTTKVGPFSRAILSVLVPLRDNDLLFTPEGKKTQELTPDLFLDWSDLVSLKYLAFTLQKSNVAGRLLRTSLDDESAQTYKEIDLKNLGDYLSLNNVNLEDEAQDFLIANYNLHQGVSSVIKSLF